MFVVCLTMKSEGMGNMMILCCYSEEKRWKKDEEEERNVREKREKKRKLDEGEDKKRGLCYVESRREWKTLFRVSLFKGEYGK